MAGLEFKESRRFSTIIFQHVEIHFFLEKSTWKKQSPLGFFKNQH